MGFNQKLKRLEPKLKLGDKVYVRTRLVDKKVAMKVENKQGEIVRMGLYFYVVEFKNGFKHSFIQDCLIKINFEGV